jgi:hypothetical protein
MTEASQGNPKVRRPGRQQQGIDDKGGEHSQQPPDIQRPDIEKPDLIKPVPLDDKDRMPKPMPG